MGNEASLEGGGAEGQVPPGSAAGPSTSPGSAKPPSAPGSGGQLPPGRAPAAAPGPAQPHGPSASTPRRSDQSDHSLGQRTASPSLKQAAQTSESTREMRSHGQTIQQADGPRRTLQVDIRDQRSGRSPSVSPDRGSTPTSPYFVPQIAPLPSSTLCPICKTTELTSSPNQPNFNTCTQCHNKVCNQCGFNPNPHLTEVKEWLCLNCQMQRALGMDMTTAPRSKSQQQLHSPSLSPSHSPAKQPQPQPQMAAGPEKQPGTMHTGPRPSAGVMQPEPPKPPPASAPREPHSQVQPKPAAPQDVVRSSPQHQQAKPSSTDQRKTVGDSPAPPPSAGAQEQPQEGLTGKLFGFGASLLTQASTLMSVQPETTPQSQQSPGKVPPKIVFSDASKETGPKAPGTAPGMQGKAGTVPAAKQVKAEQVTKPKEVPKERVLCPLCKAQINVGSGEPSNYNTCTTCKQQVCNMCGFNPTPHLVEKNEWLCLNCQTQRLLEGSLGDPAPMPLPAPKQQPTGSPRHQPGGIGQQQRGAPQQVMPQKPDASAPQTRPLSQAKQLRTSEQSKLPTTVQEKKPPAPSEGKSLSKLPEQPPKVSESPLPKGKSTATKPETDIKDSTIISESQKMREQEESSKPYPSDLSRSPQSLSDTGYSSDGISSSQSEITGLVQQEEEQLNETGIVEQSPPSPSELTKLESSMRPLLESKGLTQESSDRGKTYHELREEQRQRPRSLSITPEAFDSDEELEDIMEEDEDSLEWENQREQRDSMESSDDFGSKLRHDYVEDSSEGGGFSPLPTRQKARDPKMTDEEFMRRQLLEMSAEEDNLEEEEEEEYDRVKYSLAKNGHKPDSEKAREAASSKRRLPHSSSSIYEEESKELETTEGDDMTSSQGGLRRFKTIELNSTNNYGRDMEISQETDISLDREPELEMESLTGSPEDRSRGEYSSTLPATTPSYTSGTSPTSISSLEEDSDSSPSRRQRLEEVKQQRKARHRSHGPLLPTIEDSSEEEELREEEELLREQEKMREVEQQRIRSTARKTKRDKEELRAQRRRERSKTPPSNLSPIEDASPTEELRQAAEMEELHRSSCSEYSPSVDSEAEGFDVIASKLYKSGSEYNLPTFMSLYSPTEKTASSGYPSSKPLKSAEEAYEEMMRKAEMFQKQQPSQQSVSYSNTFQQVSYRSSEGQNNFEYQYIDDYGFDSPNVDSSQSDYQNELSKSGAVYEEILQTSQNISRMHQSSSLDLTLEQEVKKKGREDDYQEKQFLNAESAYESGPLTPGTSPTQLSAPVSFSSTESSAGRIIPDVRVTQHFAKESHEPPKLHSSPTAPSSISKSVTMPYTYAKGSSTVTTVVSSPVSAPRIYSSPTSLSGSDVPSVSTTSRNYSQIKVTASYGSQTENISRVKSVTEISGPSAREKLQSMTESKTNVSMSTPKMYSFFKSSSPPLSPSSPTQSPTHSTPRAVMPSSTGVGSKSTAEFSTQTHSTIISYDIPTTTAISMSSPMVAQGTQTPHRSSSPRLARQQSSQESPFMVITLASDVAIQTKPIGASSSISPASSPTRQGRQQTVHSYSQTVTSAAQLQQEQLQSTYTKTQSVLEKASASSAAMQKVQTTAAAAAESISGVYSWGTLPAENISLCRISSIPGTSRVEPGPRPPGSNIVDLRTAIKSTPIIITDQGMDLTSLATESRKYCLTMDQSPSRHSTAIQPLIINLNAQEQPHAIISTATTVSITVASSMLVSQPKQPAVYGDPFQNRMDFGQGTGSAVCLTHVKQVEQAVQTGTFRGTVSGTGISASGGWPEAGGPQQMKFARYNLPNQMTPLMKKDALITQTSSAQNIASAIPRPFPQDQSSEVYRGMPMELKTQSPSIPLGSKKSQVMMVQMDDIAAGPVTKLIKDEPPPNALDLTGMKPESQVACCDVVYKFPFGGSCTGAFNPSSKLPEKNAGEATHAGKPGGQYYGSREQEASDTYPYREQTGPGTNPYDEHRFYPHGLFGRLYSSMSDTNLSEMGLNYYPVKGEQPFHSPAGDSAVDLTTMKHSYSISFTEGSYMGHGMQYGSFSDLRQPSDLLSHSFPMRRYSSASNIYSDYRYSPRADLANFQEASLAHYSATTAREISRMCAALNSMDQYGGRHTNSPDLLQYGPSALGAGPGGSGSIPAQQGAMKPNMMYNPNFPESRPGFGNLAQYNLSRLGAIRQVLPSTATVRAADGMIYSTINTPIASTLPITTQPVSVLRPMLRGLYRPYAPSSITPVPLASLTRVPVVTPRIPLAAQGLYRYPVPSRLPAVPATSVMETPMYLGKPASTTSSSTVTTSVSSAPVSKLSAPTAVSAPRPEQTGTVTREEVSAATSGVQATSRDPSQGPQQPPQIPIQKLQVEVPQSSAPSKGATEREEKEKEEERQRKQQEHILQIEREKVELEKLRQLRLHEELERERVELQRHREKEQMLMHREIQELQSIKHQVLQQQQEERQAQFALQREQLAQQRMQLEQIQQLQQQLQQQLEEQKRQKPAFPPVCDQAGRIPPQGAPEIAIEIQRTLAQNGQYWPPLSQPFMATAAPGQDGQAQPRFVGLQRPLTNSASEMSLQTEDQWEASRGIKKRNSMPRLRDAYDKEPGHEPYVVKKITDSSVQTDEEDGEERFYTSRRRRTRRSTDCSVQTDEEDNAEWEQPVRRRRSRFTRHSDSGAESKQDSSTKGMASIAIQTISDCSVQTEPDQLHRVSPSIHITTPDPKVEIVKYISAPEKTHRGESLACQTEPEAQPQPGIVVPQLTVPTTITPYSSNIQIVSTGPLDPHVVRQQALVKKKPDPLEIGYQSHLPTDSLSQLVSRQPPKSPQVLYSPVSPLSPHRLLESSFTTSERLNKAHVTPQKHFTAESTQRQQTLPRPIKTMQRSLSDPKPISPTSEESAKDRFSLYQHALLPGSQISALQSNTLTRKVKRTLPSPPPEEAHLPLASQAHSQMYMPGLMQKGMGGQAVQVTKASLLKDIDRDLKLVEHESTKLRKKQAELDEEEKEIDAKLKYLELGINQRKESLLKDRNVRDYPYLRCLGENRDYMSDSELNNLRLSSYESGSLLTRPSTAPSNQYADFSSAQYTSASSYTQYQYSSGQAAPPGPATFQQTRFQPPHYPAASNAPAQNGFQASQMPAYPSQTTYQPHSFTPSTGYQSELGLQSHQGFRPPYQAQTTYSNQAPLQPAQNTLFQTHADTHTTSQKPRQTSLADLEQKIPTNYEVISNPTVVISAATPEVTYSTTTVTSSYDQYKAPEGRPTDRSGAVQSPSTSYSSDSLYTNLEQNIPRNYVMIDDISELTKESSAGEGQKGDLQSQSSNGRHIKEKGDLANTDVSSRPCCYSKGEEESEEDMYDHHGPDHRGKNYHRGPESNGRMTGSSGSYYYGDIDYRHSSRPDKHGSSIGMQKHTSKNLAPAVISSKRSKHRKQGMEQKISKFSPIEEAKDVESDLASYTVTTSVSSSSVASRAKKLQDDITYGLKKNVYDQQKYYGMSSRDMMEEDDRAYSGGRSRSSGYVSEKLSSREVSSRSRSYERESMERPPKGSSKPSSLSMGQSRGRPPMRTQTSEEESPISPLGKSMGVSRSSGGPLPQSAGDSCSQFCSSHSLPDVQEHIKDVPRTHSYKHEEGYIMDDSHCVVSDSEAYHLGQEETDWFDKPREPRSERMRHYGGHSSSSQKRGTVKHTYHDYDEPPDEDLWHHSDYSHPRHSSSKEHRHHGDYGRHTSSSRHSSDDLPRRSSRQHPRDPGRHESRGHGQPSSQKKAQQADMRTQPGYPSSSSEYSQQSRQPSGYHHTSESQKPQRQMQHGPSSQQPKSEPLSHPQQQQQQQQQTRQQQAGQQQQQQQQQASARQQQQSGRQPQQHSTAPSQQSSQQQPQQVRMQQQQQQPPQQQPLQQQQPPPPGTQPSTRPAQQQPGQPQPLGKPQSTVQAQSSAHQAGPPKTEQTDASKPTTKVLQVGRAPQTQPQGTTAGGIKLGPKPAGAPTSAGAAAGQPGAEGESVFSKILPGGAAEQAGKLTEAVSAFGKKFTSFW
ncbi:protein bassoon isoform X3 [Heteronotia binoei]|uniref:protein bassoon isoform X3 n=1 Tax=Heteronotia binoei TaxID=13085 RepID=UPI00292D9F18|nr:protein bassoon isoform X3 [Heteronotia binoei]XP_060096031.1 protein bassoon isoform X3 [Heteronotia binoei]XP_060096032.1 protein bassoon isoform X3 [Heteronotia binoei]XP_060096033.1 protein bassoon isoform X3 [Heteronotia binoei]